MTFSEKLVEVAQRYIGVAEKPPNTNSGPDIDRWLALVGFPKSHQPWCAAFVYAMLDLAAAECRVKNPFEKMPLKARAFSYSEFGERQGWIIKGRGEPGNHEYPAGSLIVFAFSHIGIVMRTLEPGKVRTIEGNTDAAGGNNGGMVMTKDRVVGLRDVILSPGKPQPLAQVREEHYIAFLKRGWSGTPSEAGNPYTAAANEITALVKQHFDLD